MSRMGGVRRIAVGTIIAGVLGYVITTVIARSLGEQYAAFAVFWSGLYFVIGALSGVQQEFSRGLVRHTPQSSSAHGARAPRTLARVTLAAMPVVVVLLLVGAPTLLPSNPLGLSVALVIGMVFQTVLFGLTGLMFARHQWSLLLVVIVAEIFVRLVLVLCVASIAPSMLALAWASVIPFPLVVGIALCVPTFRRVFMGATFDAQSRRILAQVGAAVVAMIGSAALTNGVTLVIAATGRDASQALVSTIVLALILTRGPIVVGTFAFQSYLVVRFRSRTAGIGNDIFRIAAGLFVGAAMLAALAYWLGPQLLVFFAGPTYVMSPGVIAVLTLTSFATGLLAVTGSAALGRNQHTAFVIGWLVAAACTLGLLALPIGLEARTLIALGVGPLVGVALHLVAIKRSVPVVDTEQEG